MTNLIINRVNFLLSDEYPNIYFSKQADFPFRIQLTHLKLRFSGEYENADFLGWIKDVNDEDYVYYSFSVSADNDYFKVLAGKYPFIFYS